MGPYPTFQLSLFIPIFLYSFAGTIANIPPEFVKHKLYDPSKEAVRSLGVIIYEMLYGRIPYQSRSEIIVGLPQFDNVSEGN